MNERICRQLIALLALLVGLSGFSVALASLALAGSASTARTLNQDLEPATLSGAAATGLAAVDTASTAKTLDRDLEPVVITGTAVSALTGFPLDELFVYVYSGGVWTQIPAQVDKVTATGAYATSEDGLLDANDEIVFMAKDLSDRAPAGTSLTDVLPISTGWYEIQVTDPTSPTRKGWAYIVHSSTLTPTFTADYVSFDTILHRINAASYSLGFATPKPFADYLTLGGSYVDIPDRTKMRLLCQIKLDPRTWLCPITEEEGLPLQDDLIKDGPVRVIVRGGRVLAYGSMARWTTVLDIPSYLEGDIRFSTDLSPAASGATHYSAVVPGGVTVDGIADTVAAEPLSPWWQVSTDSGTLIQVADTTPIGGIQTNYYLDNSQADASDTGDRRHYGDTGVYIKDPNLTFTYTFALCSLAGTQPNVGATYQAYFMQPLSVAALREGLSAIYLPAVMRNVATSSTWPP